MDYCMVQNSDFGGEFGEMSMFLLRACRSQAKVLLQCNIHKVCIHGIHDKLNKIPNYSVLKFQFGKFNCVLKPYE